MSEQNFARLRVAIVGSCQVVGLAAAAQRLLPGAEVESWHIGVHPKDSDEDIAARLPGFDLVITQIADGNEHIPLSISRLREQRLPAVFLPVLMFAGFHPDITYVRNPDGSMLPGVGTDYHSLIVAATFELGLPEVRIPALFNHYVFNELGYFEVFEAAKTALLDNFDHAGYDVGPLFENWSARIGQFMYTINHPHILVLASLCRIVLARGGYIDSATTLPDDIPDSLGAYFIWPTYPALGRRIGLSGSLTFLRNAHGVAQGQTRELSMAGYVSACFRIYGDLPKGALRKGIVATACDRLAQLLSDEAR